MYMYLFVLLLIILWVCITDTKWRLVHVPKTGGTFLKKIISKNPKFIYDNNHTPAHKMSGNKFAIVRNPYSRFLSSFNYLYDGGKTFPSQQFQNDVNFMKFLKAQNIKNPHDIFVSPHKQKILDYIHFKPMSYYLYHNGRLSVKKILKHETLDADFKTHFAIDLPKEKVNVSNKHIEKLSVEEQMCIHKYYKKDFELFEYYNIPMIIHQTWKNDDVSTYGTTNLGTISQQSWKKNYPDFTYVLWTDEKFEEYLFSLNNEEWINTYNSLNEKIKKIDFLRYIVLYTQGGVYSDLDFVSHKRIPARYFAANNFLGYKATRDSGWVLGQAFFACIKGFPDMKKVIDAICQDRYSTENPLIHTGPEKFHSIIKLNSETHVFEHNEICDRKNRGVYGYHYRHHQW